GIPSRRPPWKGRAGRYLLIICAALFFFGPGLAGVLGAQPGQIENRRLAAFPSITSGWHFFAGFTSWATDHLPLRDRAVRLNTTVAEKLWHQPPSYGQQAGAGDTGVPVGGVNAGSGPVGHAPSVQVPPVIVGQGGTIFLGDEIGFPCNPQLTHAQVFAATNRFAALVRSTGARFALVVPPDKSSIEPNLLPAAYPGKSCANAEKADLWRQLDAHPPAGYIDTYRVLQRLQARTPEPIFRHLDSHWAPLAAATYAEAVAAGLDPRVTAGTHIVGTGPQTAIGDETKLLGTPQTNTFPGFDVRRDGVSLLRADGGKIGNQGISHLTASSRSAQLITGPTLIFNDSFNTISLPQERPFFADLTLIANQGLDQHVAAMAQAIRQSKTVVLEVVERAYGSGNLTLFEPRVLDALAAALAH
ncbi:MAG TPA: hypothetical protein VGN54_08405, partial [Mycobacteriales bacterium]|nr:hypothetical protein [Mycobacteriales bacterium]